MRGTIEVDAPAPAPETVSTPLYVSLGIDLDAPHPSSIVPEQMPISSVASAQLLKSLASLQGDLYYRSHPPSAAWRDIRSAPATFGMSDQDVWNLTASLWQASASPQALEQGRRLYAQNCAACHGARGDGGGVFAEELAASTAMRKPPAALSDPTPLLGASPALLQGKILRGGMGTGMPSWGPIFTDEQTWNLVAYLYTFQFSYR
jgi:mono/diheme cytochrome c family protein